MGNHQSSQWQLEQRARFSLFIAQYWAFCNGNTEETKTLLLVHSLLGCGVLIDGLFCGRRWLLNGPGRVAFIHTLSLPDHESTMGSPWTMTHSSQLLPCSTGTLRAPKAFLCSDVYAEEAEPTSLCCSRVLHTHTPPISLQNSFPSANSELSPNCPTLLCYLS